jgi:hypothetical protein
LRNEELHGLYSSSNIIRMIKSRRMRWPGNVVRVEEKTVAYTVSVATYEGKRLLQRPTCRREDNIKMDLQEIGWQGEEWIDVTGCTQGLRTQ